MNNNEIYKPFAEFAKQIIEAKDIAFRKHIKANAIIINDNFLDVPKWQEYSRGVCGQSNCVDYPEMICGLEAHHTKVALPDNILFAVCEVQETYHDRIRREIAHQVRKETAKEFAEKVKMAFYYEFDEIIPSIMADKIDELLNEYGAEE